VESIVSDQGIQTNRYVIVSPVKDEEKYIETTIRTVLNQTIKPMRWIIVDDGSRDATPIILDRLCSEITWIMLLTIRRDAERRLGRAEVGAFNCGYHLTEDLDFDFVVKLDGDVDLPPDYFERVMARFHWNGKLGIASGAYVEENGGRWIQKGMPHYHAAGASKVIRFQCFNDIGGFIVGPGWDTLDEIRARAKGWETEHFADICFRHLKPEGSASGFMKIAYMCGQIDYLTGVDLPFASVKALHRSVTARPPLFGGFAMLTGFLHGVVSRRPKLVTQIEESLYRRVLRERRSRMLKSAYRRLLALLG
jgi:poly-beta-1,6-N-acetyl-D-glucosamine synthase